MLESAPPWTIPTEKEHTTRPQQIRLKQTATTNYNEQSSSFFCEEFHQETTTQLIICQMHDS